MFGVSTLGTVNQSTSCSRVACIEKGVMCRPTLCVDIDVVNDDLILDRLYDQ